MSEPRCYVCQKAEADDPEVEIRPYGKDGQPICFDCMIADPERERDAEQIFNALTKGPGVFVLDGTSGGARPATFDEERMASSVLPGLPRPGKA